MDLKPLWDYAKTLYLQIYRFYDVLEGKEISEITTLRHLLHLPNEKRINFALCQRIINLKEDPIVQIIGNNPHQKKIMFDFVNNFYRQKFEDILSFIHTNQLLTPFYRTLLEGVHQIGLNFNALFWEWNATLIEGFNAKVKDPHLKQLLTQSIDKTPSQAQGERSYSIPKQTNNTLEFLTYAQAFPTQIQNITSQIQALIDSLIPLQDTQKIHILAYLESLIHALQEKNRENIVQRWQEADTLWVQIDSPLQIVHPMEYYEDIYRHSVAPEWDIRLQNPYSQNNSQTKQNILNLFAHYSYTSNPPQALQSVKFYDCTPLFFYGSLNNGLFSAQVIPNDENIAQKKIFAYTQRILDSLRSKPTTKLEVEIFPSPFLQAYHMLLQDEAKWKEVYDISTNGHEYGHILWVDTTSESLMNTKGEFKNIEEFKATCGGLMAYFQSPNQALLQEVMLDHLHRVVKLISYQKVFEVLPYYCESLLHLSGAFESQILTFKNQTLEVHWKRLPEYIQWYQEVYSQLIDFYCAKKEAGEFLFRYLHKQNGIYLPNLFCAKEFVLHYYQRYTNIGQEVLSTQEIPN